MNTIKFDYLFIKTIKSFKKEIRDLYKKKAVMPCLMLLYSFIDILAWLRYESEQRKVGARYKKYLKSYLLPQSKLGCTAEDIYSARCGLLHQYSAESDKVRTGAAKKIHYSAYEPKKTTKPTDKKTIIIHVEDLIQAFEKSIENLLNELKANPCLRIEVTQRSWNWLITFKD